MIFLQHIWTAPTAEWSMLRRSSHVSYIIVTLFFMICPLLSLLPLLPAPSSNTDQCMSRYPQCWANTSAHKTLHHTTSHCITLHHTTHHIHPTSLNKISLHNTAHHTTPHCTRMHQTTPYTKLHHTPHHITTQYITVKLHHTPTLHRTTPHCTTLHHTTTNTTPYHICIY